MAATFTLRLQRSDKNLVRSLNRLLYHIAVRDAKAVLSTRPKVIIFPASDTDLAAAVALVSDRVLALLE